MRRTLLALAIAGLSSAAFAGPPGPPVSGPFDVNVANQPISTSSTLTWVSPSRYWSWGTSDVVSTSAFPEKEIDAAVVLTGVLVRLQMTPAPDATDRCFAAVSLDYLDGAFVYNKRLAAASVLNGDGVAQAFVPLPNIYADVGSRVRASVISSDAAATCVVDLYVYGVMPD